VFDLPTPFAHIQRLQNPPEIFTWIIFYPQLSISWCIKLHSSFKFLNISPNQKIKRNKRTSL